MADSTSELLWYVVHTYSGYENKVKANLEKAVENNGMQELITEVRIPVEETVEIRAGRKKIVPRKLLPGYVMIRMRMTNESWYVVRNTRGVTGFVGPGSKPEPLTEEEFMSLGEQHVATELDFKIGDEVQILAGLFENFIGKVAEIDNAAKKVKVAVQMMRSETTVELEFDQIVRANQE